LDTPFIFKLVLSFIVGSLWTVCATLVADRLGPKAGGLVSGLPSTVVLGLFFLASTQDLRTAVQATTVIPLVAGINSLFLAAYVYMVRKNIWQAIVSSLTLWFVLAYLLARTRFNNYAISLLAFGLLALLAFFLMEKVFRVTSTRGNPIHCPPGLILVRAFTGGVVVSLAVFLGKIGGPLWGGIFSTFPAMFISTMLVTYFAHGPLFSAGVMKSAMLGGMSVVAYAVTVRSTYLPLGLWLGTLLSLFVSYGSAWAIHRYVINKLR
jgi:Protein of unknown function (DUF3147)